MSKEVTGFVYRLLSTEFFTSGKRVSFCLQMQRVHLSHGRFISCSQGDKEKGQSVPLTSALS